jgi:esterase/lipase superfamily enzyme
MEIEYHKWWSPALNQDMELKVYGHSGKPVLVFPCMNGRFFEFEDYGMVHTVTPALDAGEVQLFTVDSIDSQSWTNYAAHPADRARRHEEYDRYITQEVVPFIDEKNGGKTNILTTGCSMGGYHSLNFFLRHPDQFDAVVSLSGVAQLNIFIGDYNDENVYFNSPLQYLKNLSDEHLIEKYRGSKIVLCSGQGSWEEQTFSDMHAVAELLAGKNIPCWLDLWGYDVNHDWPWWRQQFPYFLKALGYIS